MSDVRSKNLYELLGNDPEQDSDREPEPPTKAVDKSAPRHGKRDAPKETPAEPRTGARGGRGGRNVNVTGNEGAFRDRNAGTYNNRSKPTEEGEGSERRGGRGRGGRGRGDRQSRTGQSDTHKQVEQGWGHTGGESAWNDEKAGEALAKRDANEPQTPGEEQEPEPEEKVKSFADYLAEQAEQKREDLGLKEARKPNEGAKADKKWAAAKEIKRGEDEEAYIKGQEEKGRRERQRKEKTFLDVDMRFVEQSRGRGDGPRGGRGGRGGERGRGGRGRGDAFRGRGDGPRGDAPRGRGDGPRGDAPRGGAPRGGRGSGPVVDEKNFPSLGGK